LVRWSSSISNSPSESSTGVARAAAIIALGNVASRILGLVRESVIAYLFGATGAVSIFRLAATLAQTLYDFLVGGMVSAALVPVFSEFAAKDRAELWRIASIVVNVLAIFLALVILILEIFAPQVVFLLGSGYDASLQAQAVEMIRYILPAIFFLGMSGIVTGLLYSLKRFTFPAFTAAAFNLGIVLVAILLSPILGITSLILGIIIGSVLQVALQLPGLRDARYHFVISFSHPTLRRILKLYAPVVAGLTISVVGVAIDRNLASHAGAQSLAWMQNATVLIQFPLGLVGTAISFAILPTLSRQSTVNSQQSASVISREQSDREISILQTEISRSARNDNSTSNFQQTLTFGIKLVLLLILPSAVGLFILARPIVALLFEHGAFLPSDTTQTALALQFYLIGLPFAAIDQPLVFAFYARKNTLLPNLVAFAAVGVYVIVALALIQNYGMIGLVIANSAQLTSHALIMLWFTRIRLGGFGGAGLGIMVVKVIAASAAMGVLAYFVLSAVGFIAINAVSVIVPGIAAIFAYAALLKIFRVREAEQVWAMLASRLTLRRPMV